MANDIITKFFQTQLLSILAHGSPWSKYLLLSDDAAAQTQARADVQTHSKIMQISEKLSQAQFDPESPKQNFTDFKVYGSFYWQLRFLADIGLTVQDYGIASFIEQVRHSQLEDGQFMVRYHQKKQQAISYVCITAHLVYCLIRLGLKATRTVSAAVDYLATTQRFDGGWHCDDVKQNGERDQFMPSCPSATIHAILALGQLGKAYHHILEKTVDQILTVYEGKSTPLCCYDSEREVRLNKLRYPPHYSGLDLLNVVYAFSFIPDLQKKSLISDLINQAISKWDRSHWLASEKKISEWKNFDFGSKNSRSDWITSLLLTSLKRIESLE